MGSHVKSGTAELLFTSPNCWIWNIGSIITIIVIKGQYSRFKDVTQQYQQKKIRWEGSITNPQWLESFLAWQYTTNSEECSFNIYNADSWESHRPLPDPMHIKPGCNFWMRSNWGLKSENTKVQTCHTGHSLNAQTSCQPKELVNIFKRILTGKEKRGTAALPGLFWRRHGFGSTGDTEPSFFKSELPTLVDSLYYEIKNTYLACLLSCWLKDAPNIQLSV